MFPPFILHSLIQIFTARFLIHSMHRIKTFNTYFVSDPSYTNGVQTFPCRFCLKIFVRANNLAVHERIHTGEKPYPCEVCGKRFNQINNKHRHMKTQHTWTLLCNTFSQVKDPTSLFVSVYFSLTPELFFC